MPYISKALTGYFFLVINIYVLGQSPQDMDWVKARLKSDVPAAQEILERYLTIGDAEIREYSDNRTQTNIYEFVMGSNRYDLLITMASNVRQFNNLLSSEYGYLLVSKLGKKADETHLYYFYLQPKEEYIISTSINFFPVNHLADVIPEERRTEHFKRYITDSTSNQTHGLLGLMDAFNSHFQSARTTWLFKNAYLEATPGKVSNYVRWLNNLNLEFLLYYEFRFFILEYLLYARTNHPQLYDDIKKDKRFRNVFKAISHDYGELVNGYMSEITSGYKTFCKKTGIAISNHSSDQYIFLLEDKVSYGFRSSIHDFDKLKLVLESNRYDLVIRETRFQ